MPAINKNKTALTDFYNKLENNSFWKSLTEQEREKFKKLNIHFIDVKGSYENRMFVYDLCFMAFVKGLQFKPCITKEEYLELKKLFEK